MATPIRTHVASPNGEATTAGTTVSGDTVAVVPANRTLIAVVSGNANRTVTGLSKPGDETASWVKVSATPAGAGTVFTEVWVIKTTVPWATGTTVTATISAACDGRSLNLLEFAGLSTVVVAQQSQRASSTQELTVTAGGLVPGDVVISAGAANSAGATNLFGVYGQLDQAYYEGTTATGTQYGEDRHRPNPAYITSMVKAMTIVGAGQVASKVRVFNYTGYSFTPTNGPAVAVVVALQSDDYPPNQPVFTSMASGGTIDRGRVNRMGWTFSSPNYVDAQSGYDLRYRLIGDTSWTVLSSTDVPMVTSPASFRDWAAGTFAAGDYEAQVRVYGALGKPSAWSPSGFFTAADPPAGPTITYPLPGQSVDQYEEVAWSAPAQDAYQFRRVADDGSGGPDPDVVYADTGWVTDSTTRRLPVNFSVNDRAEHLQIRVKVDTLPSEWDDVPVEVSYTPPPAPSWVPFPDPVSGSLLVTITNPDPDEDVPPAVANSIWVNDGPLVGAGGWERRAVGVPVNGAWRYDDPVGGRDYTTQIRIEARAANGISSWSEGGRPDA